MSKLEEIKERASNEEYVKRDIDYYEAQEDIQYLLSKLWTAEKALQKVFDDQGFMYLHDALQQIRE